MPQKIEFLLPGEAWDELQRYRQTYYRKYIAAYNGDRAELNATSSKGTFWERPGKAKVHVPLAADIAATSADLLFSEEPKFTCYDEKTEDNESPQQHRLDELIQLNNVHGLLNEGAETCAALGDVFLRLSWRQEDIPYPVLTVTQGDCAWPEYMLGVLKCVHFFSILKVNYGSDVVYRLYERYEKGRIISAIYKGSETTLGARISEDRLAEFGLIAETKAPINEMLAVHIPNVRPNRRYRDSMKGRSDFDELRDLLDSLDEAYSSWMRDIRLAKARLIVPAEYLRRRNKDLFDGTSSYTYEFDEDVETLVALDIDTSNKSANPITPSQFAIRAGEHAATCADIVRNIVTQAGYAPQTFGLNIEGMAQSGTALHIREKKSFNTRNKKQTYWKSPLESIMTAMVHLDAALFPDRGSDLDDQVRVQFSDSMSSDLSTISGALQMLNSAMAISTEMKIQLLHPDWTQKQVQEEVGRVKRENGLAMDSPIMELGDLHTAITGTPPEAANGGEV